MEIGVLGVHGQLVLYFATPARKQEQERASILNMQETINNIHNFNTFQIFEYTIENKIFQVLSVDKLCTSSVITSKLKLTQRKE